MTTKLFLNGLPGSEILHRARSSVVLTTWFGHKQSMARFAVENSVYIRDRDYW